MALKNTPSRKNSSGYSAQNIQEYAAAASVNGIALFEYWDIDRAVEPIGKRVSENCVEILYMQRGIQIFQIGGRELVVNGGDVLIVPAGVEYSTGHHPQYKSSYHRLRVERNVPSLLGLAPEYSVSLKEYLFSLKDIHYYGNARLGELLESAFGHINAGTPAVRKQGYGELVCFFASLESLLQCQAPQRAPDIEAALRYINEHITEEITLNELARLSGSSLSYFKERFTAQTGVTPLYYINWRKIAFAKRMIAHDDSVTQVALMLGFTTPAYFSTVFKNYTGRTPMQYKRTVDIELKKQHHIFPASTM